MTNAFGQYRLYGVPPQAEIRVSASEYDARTFSFQITENTTRNLAVPLIGSRPTLSGNYTVFIDAVACPSVFGRPPLPADLQHRAYEAVMTQTGAALDLKFTGGQFRTNGLNKGDGFKGSVIAGGARFTLDWYDFYYYPFYGPNTYPSVAERLPDGNYLVTTGTVNLTGTAGTGFTGTFTAQFSSLMNLFDANFPTSSRLLAGCSSGQTMRLIRR
jgi:hypothetical protein